MVYHEIQLLERLNIFTVAFISRYYIIGFVTGEVGRSPSEAAPSSIDVNGMRSCPSGANI